MASTSTSVLLGLTGFAACGCAGGHATKRIVLTGGPGAGKTAVLEIVRRSACEHSVFLPEAATIVFGGGFPRVATVAGEHAAQKAIYAVQSQLEAIAVEEDRAALVFCDRGTIDGAAYWPGSADSFWSALGTTRERELARYDVVVHLRTPPADSGYRRSPVRIESALEAERIDARIFDAWHGHPRRFVVPSAHDFIAKASQAVAILMAELPPCCARGLAARIQAEGALHA